MNQVMLDRFTRKHTNTGVNGCWLWTGAKTSRGYANFTVDGRTTYAHRASYEHFVSPVPDGMVLDHLCRVRGCVNPDHLEPVSHAMNVARGEGGQHNAIKTHCPRGHEYAGGNLYVQPSTGGRKCRACRPLRGGN
jgi:hypothetical protein